jgi:hypothetical protein
MWRNFDRLVKCCAPFLCVSAVILLAATAVILSEAQNPERGHIGLVRDWSNRHLIFTNGGSPEVVAAAARDPRSWMNWVHRSGFLFRRPGGEEPTRPPRPIRRRAHIDWAMSLGPNAGMAVGETPAKFGFSSSGNLTFPASCDNDFVVYTIGATPAAGGQANVVAFRNLYTGTTSSSCPNGPQTPPTTNLTQPTFMWAYAVGTGAVSLSPAISLDGKKVAFIESANRPMFDVLTWVAGQGTDATHAVAPGTGGSSVTRLDYTNVTTAGCTANPVTANANSSQYIDYGSNAAFVGASNGVLYHIRDVFVGTPSVDFCITVNANAKLTSPVYNQINNRVYISDGFSVYAYQVNANSFTLIRSIAVAGNGSTDPIVLSPIVDTTNGFVYAFSGENATNTNSVVSQMDLDLTSQVQAAVGPGFTGRFIFDGDFDNNYFTNGPKGAGATLYVCGTQTGNAAKPSLYALSFSSTTGIMNTTPAMSNNPNVNTAANPNSICSPLVEFFDGTTDRLFVGVGASGATTGGNLVTQWNINNRITSNTAAPSHTATGEWGGTTAFTPDNVSAAPQAASVYFGTLSKPPNGTATPCGTGNFCAVKLTQSALQ